MPDEVFISYSRSDRERVLPLVTQLREAGFTVWLDADSIEGAELWGEEIVEAIDGCRVMLLGLSPRAAASRHVAREVYLASEAGKPILPLLLEPTALPATLRYHLAGVQHLDLTGSVTAVDLQDVWGALSELGIDAPIPAASPLPRETAAAGRVSVPRSGATNLPAPLTRFIGRAAALEAVCELLEAHRLITLRGMGGAGKTRLALEIGRRVLEHYPDGVWLVELAALSDPHLVPQTVASSLGVREAPGQPILATLADHLRRRELLLVLDNCEHLVEACAHLASTLLGRCAGLRVLSTSRQVLGAPGEVDWHVPSLAGPGAETLSCTEDHCVDLLLESEAAELFIDRARLGFPGFEVEPEDVPVIAQICRRLDGIPLALELAAARVRVLSVKQIGERLDDRFNLLSGGSRAVLPRHQTLRATMDWSYDLISEGERLLLRRLSVFTGGWTLEAAERLANLVSGSQPGAGDAPRGGLGLGRLLLQSLGLRGNAGRRSPGAVPPPARSEELSAGAVLDLLSQLVDRSLVVVVRSEDDRTRYNLLETVREYGRERLREAGEEEHAQRSHAEWCRDLVERAEARMLGVEQALWVEHLEAELDNVRAALDWSMPGTGSPSSPQPAALVNLGMRIVGALWRFWVIRGYVSEGRQRCEQALAAVSLADDKEAAAKVLTGAGVLAYFAGDYRMAAERCARSLAAAREVGNRWMVAVSLLILGTYHQYYEGEAARAHAEFTESLALGRQVGDDWLVSLAMGELGLQALYQGDLKAAGELAARSVALARLVQNRWLLAVTLGNLGFQQLHCGQVGSASAALRESLSYRQEQRDQLGIAICLQGLAMAAGAMGDCRRHARLFGAAEGILERIGAYVPPAFRASCERLGAQAKTNLADPAYAAAWEDGKGLALERAIAEALAGGNG